MNLLKFILVISILLSFTINAQIGSRLKEIQNQKKLVKHIKKSGWIQRKWTPNQLNVIEPEKKLFKRHMTNNGKIKEKLQKKINKNRNRKRVRGNNVFYKRKYFR